MLLLLQRFGIADIKQHPWFLENLPDGALEFNNTLMQQAHSLDEVSALFQLIIEPMSMHEGPKLEAFFDTQ